MTKYEEMEKAFRREERTMGSNRYERAVNRLCELYLLELDVTTDTDEDGVREYLIINDEVHGGCQEPDRLTIRTIFQYLYWEYHAPVILKPLVIEASDYNGQGEELEITKQMLLNAFVGDEWTVYSGNMHRECITMESAELVDISPYGYAVSIDTTHCGDYPYYNYTVKTNIVKLDTNGKIAGGILYESL